MAILKQKNGLYRVVIAERTVMGTPLKRRSIGTFRTKTLARAAQAKALEKREGGQRIVPDRTSLNDVFAGFMKAARERGLSGTTLYRYEQLWRCYVRDRIGSWSAATVTALQLEAFYGELLRSGGEDRSGAARPIGVRSVQHVHGLIASVLRWAQRSELVDRNVASIAQAPKGRRRVAKAFEEDEVDRLLETARRYRRGPLIAFALETGLRRGELAALRWTDIDFTRRVAVVRGAIAEVPGRTWFKATKQETERGVALSAGALDALRDQRRMQDVERIMAGASYREDGYVFARPTGAYSSPGSIGNAVRLIAKRAGLATTRLHALRHTTATVLLRQGEDIATVAAVLRHTSPATTLSVYAHEVLGAQRAAVDKASLRRRARRPSVSPVEDDGADVVS